MREEVSDELRRLFEAQRRRREASANPRPVDGPAWTVGLADGELELVWSGEDLPVAEWYRLAAWENPDDSANTMPDVALDALAEIVSRVNTGVTVAVSEAVWRGLTDELERLRRELEDVNLALIAARNPGIDMSEVRRIRGEQP